jgi:hypothetical protein
VLVAQVAIFLESFVDDVFEPRRDFAIQSHHCDWRAIHDGFADYRGAFSVKGHIGGRHFVEDRAK